MRRRRRFAFLLRAMAMVPPSFTTMCGHQAQTPPPATKQSEAARIGGIAVKRDQTPRQRSKVEVPPSSSARDRSISVTIAK